MSRNKVTNAGLYFQTLSTHYEEEYAELQSYTEDIERGAKQLYHAMNQQRQQNKQRERDLELKLETTLKELRRFQSEVEHAAFCEKIQIKK